MDELEIKVKLQISKPVSEVKDAIIRADKMANYFIAEGARNMEEGKNIQWTFPEFPEMIIDVKILKIDSDQVIFEWEGSKNKQLEVRIDLEERPGNSTLITVSEGKMKYDPEGIVWLKRNTEGWSNFLACMKAYLEFGINLRKGGFEFMKAS
ncbi:SRPBCC domain-containing protein [Christiangramia sp. SM2212]|uniref:SRPBCC domain-containing protein n=1 Tax=Christiangramia sediminicola TaxID=3073267 RepID=A0ABU1ELF8_9FLAO|nr:SRPBCC domain-containing protein [Christiangramia sp. SM2212]MDR5589191.1 SRPBCC domain-containing protein [Christiangramia sp. SM2212]